MGMFDNVTLHMLEEPMDGQYQTKDLYNGLYNLGLCEKGLFYIKEDGTWLPLTCTVPYFTITRWIGNSYITHLLGLKDGQITFFMEDIGSERSLAYLQEMQNEDAWAEDGEVTTNYLIELYNKRPWYSKLGDWIKGKK